MLAGATRLRNAEVAGGSDHAVVAEGYAGIRAGNRHALHTVPYLDYVTTHLLHEPQDAGDARIEVWLGRQIDYLPARVRITEANGDTFEHTVQTAYIETVPTASTR